MVCTMAMTMLAPLLCCFYRLALQFFLFITQCVPFAQPGSQPFQSENRIRCCFPSSTLQNETSVALQKPWLRLLCTPPRSSYSSYSSFLSSCCSLSHTTLFPSSFLSIPLLINYTLPLLPPLLHTILLLSFPFPLFPPLFHE